MLQVTLHKKSPVAHATGDLLQLYFIGQLLLLYKSLLTVNNIYSRLCNLLKLAAAEVIDTFQLSVLIRPSFCAALGASRGCASRD